MDSGSPYHWLKDMNGEDRDKYLARILNASAKFIESGSIMNADTGLDYIAHVASPDGDAMQRVATYIGEGLALQALKNLHGVPRALILSQTLSTSEEQQVKKLFYDLYPFLKVSYVITSHAIAEAMDGEDVIHVIDLSASDSSQWIFLMKRLKENKRKTRLLKITGIHDKREVLEEMYHHLTNEAQKLKFNIQFYPIESTLSNLDLKNLPLEKGEPLAITSVLHLHSLLTTDDPIPMVCSSSSPAESMNQRPFAEMLGKRDSSLLPFLPSCSSSKIMHFLNSLMNLQPRLMVITEQESNVNVSSLTERVDKALDFYGALFQCLESTVSNTRVERVILERTLLGEEIKNIIACEGVERKERHEKLETWIQWLELVGFGRRPISFDGVVQATKALDDYGIGYKLCPENKCLFLCWNDKPLFSVSVWKV